MDLPAWTRLVSQHNRLIELETTLPDAFAVERFRAREAVSEPFLFEIDCLSANASIDLRPLLSTEATLRLRGPGGGRTWHGCCTQAAQLGSEGGLARYRIRLEPWTALLRLRRNRLIHQDLDERGIIERLFAHYPQANYRFDISRPLSPRPVRTQWESDFDFLARLLADAGLAYRFEHPGDADRQSGARASHVLVIHDDQASAPEASPATLRFHRVDATEAEDAAVLFTEKRQVTTNAVAVASWERDQVRMSAARAELDATGLPTLEVYQAARSGAFPTAALAQSAADLRLQALHLPARLHAGAGSGRGLAPGHAFTLEQHPDLHGDRFVPLVVEHTAVNNLGSHAVTLLGSPALEEGDYRNRFVCVPAGVAVVPMHIPRPTAPGPQTALVVGLPDAGVTSSRDHEVRLQFWWQRGALPNPGGLQDTGGKDPGHAPGDASSGTWVPVAESVAGPDFGSHFLPRLGSEVLVDFEHGDLDRPVVVAQLYGGAHLPPYAGGEDSESNHPGVLSGLRTTGLDGQQDSRWIVDDTPRQLRHQLDTGLAASRLGLGLLIDQTDANRGGLRGEGFELDTRGWSMQRAGEGFLISTSARPAAASTLHDAAEAVAGLEAAVRTATSLSERVAGVDGFPLQANPRQEALLEAIDPLRKGRYDGPVNSQPAARPKGQGREPGDEVERIDGPRMLQESASHLVYGTSHSLLAYAGGAQHWTAGEGAHLAAGATFAAVSGASAGCFAGSGTLQMVAASGPLSLQAHAAGLEVLADRTVSITSTESTIEVTAQEKIVLQAGESAITLEGGDIVFACPGDFTVKSSQNLFLGGERNAAALPALPAAEFAFVSSLRFAVTGSDSLAESMGWVGRNFKVRDGEGATLASGVVDASGRLPRATHDGLGTELTLEIGDGGWKTLAAAPAATAPEADPESEAAPEPLHADGNRYSQQLLDDAVESPLDPGLIAELLGLDAP
ncbi:type VI secretion system Vgr family protein [Luteimonas sp. A501]